jgi:Fibronectin type III domain.
VPTGLKVTKLTGMEAEVEWVASYDNVKVKSYEVYRDGDKVGKMSSTSYKLKQLIPGKSYVISVRAFDMSGNISGFSNSIKITTTKDLEAPSTPTGLKVKSVKGTSVALTWNESEDDIKVKGYRIYCNGLMIATSTKAGRTVKVSKDLIIGIFQVKAYDLVENLSASSNKVTVLF